MLDKFSGSRVIRVMPNTPVTIGEGCSVYTPGKNVSKADILLVRYMFETSGFAQMVPENLINAVGALSGSGPAFVGFFARFPSRIDDFFRRFIC